MTDTKKRCESTKTRAPAPGDVGVNGRGKAVIGYVNCVLCGKLVKITARGKYAPHYVAPPKQTIRPSSAAKELFAKLVELAGRLDHTAEDSDLVWRREARAICESMPQAGKWSWRLEIAKRAWESVPAANRAGRPRLCKAPKEKPKVDPAMRAKRVALYARLDEINAALKPSAHAIVPKDWLLKQKENVLAEMKALGIQPKP